MGKKSKKRNVVPKKAGLEKQNTKANPFEIRFNKQRHSILGRRTKKERGMPGVSRTKSINKREQSLLKEYKDFNKVNSFIDRRIGENDAETDPDERALARFAKEWRKNKKNTMFNLNDEDLTHMGKSLSEIDDFHDTRSDSEDENDKLSSDFIKKAHFGGFMTLKSANSVEPEKSHKEMMQELIMETKKQKYERQSERETNDNLTDKLDEEWKLLQGLVSKSKQSTKTETPKADDSYDIAVRSLKFEIKGKPTDRLKTEDEIVKEAQEKMARLEADRQKRMTENEGKSRIKTSHISADSLDDGIALDDNLSNDEESEEKGTKQRKSTDDPDNGNVNENIEDDSDDQEQEDESDSESCSSGENIYTGMFSDESDSENSSVVEKEENRIQVNKQMKKMKQLKEIPSNLEELCAVFCDKSTSQRIQILESIIKKNHPNLGKINVTKMENFFRVLILYVCKLCTEEQFDSSMIDGLIPKMYELLQLSTSVMSKSLLDYLAIKRKEFLKSCKMKNGRKIPSLDTLILFKLVSVFYPTSDFHHPVVTASELFMSEILFISQISTLQDIGRGLFICNLFLEYVSYAKRFVPEAVDFLQKLLSKRSLKILAKSLSITERNETKTGQIPLKWLVDGNEISFHSSAGFSVLACSINLLKEFAKLYTDLPSYQEIFGGVYFNLEDMMSQQGFEFFTEDLKDLQIILSKKPDNKLPLSHSKKKVKCLKMYEPRLQAEFTGKKQRPVMSAKKAERQKLQYKYKKEFKGAVREIRRDNQYISRVQLNEQMERDNERKQKLKRLYQDLAQQEGEFKHFKKRRK